MKKKRKITKKDLENFKKYNGGMGFAHKIKMAGYNLEEVWLEINKKGCDFVIQKYGF